LLRSTAVLGAFSPATVSRLLRGGDELSVIARMCAHQIHQHRCTAKVVAVAGDLLTAGRPGSAAVPPAVNPGAVGIGTAAAVLGLATGDVGRAVTWGVAGAGAGSFAWSAVQERECQSRQAQLDRLSEPLEGSLTSLSLGAIDQLIVSNVRSRRLSQQQADVLVAEANKLARKAYEVINAAR
jgi:hypothetical protein